MPDVRDGDFRLTAVSATTRPETPRGSESATITYRAESVIHDYSGVVVLSDVDFEFRTGAVEALVGENGSGKSTLVKILTGALRPTAATLTVGDRVVSFSSPADAQNDGVSVVHQDGTLFPDLTVAENVLRLTVGAPRRRWLSVIDRRAMDRQVREDFDSLAIDIPANALVRSLPATERVFVEIARAMLLKPRFLILDEPTASLEPRAATNLLTLLDRLRSQGVGLMFVSHRLDEVMRLADHMTVLRDGRVVGRLTGQEATEAELARLIIGARQDPAPAAGSGEAGALGDGNRTPAEEPALSMSDIRLTEDAPPAGIEVHEGEILGLTGLLGSGITEVTRMLGGVIPPTGDMEVYGQPVEIRTPHDAQRMGIGFIPEDRKELGIIPDQSVALNISLASLPAVATAGVLSNSGIDQRAREYRTKLDIRLASIHARAKTLSGGNAQKVLIARWLASGVRILVVEEPTHGIDVGAKTQVHALLEDFAAAGGAIIIASTDVREIVTLCDRIAIFHDGVLDEVLSKDVIGQARSEASRSGTDEQQLLERLITGARSRRDANAQPPSESHSESSTGGG